MPNPTADRTTPAPTATPHDLLVDSRRPLMARFKDRVPAIIAANPHAKKHDLVRDYLSWIENLSADKNAKLDRAYRLADQLGRTDAEDWHESYTTGYVIDSLLPMLETEAAANAIAKGPAN